MTDLLLILRYPLTLLPISFLVLWLSGWFAATRFKTLRLQMAETHEQFSIIQAATLTLLGLIIGFTFSMALNRYDQRKNLEEGEANAIGTEYVRADFLPEADVVKVRALLLSYVDQRVLFYTTRDEEELKQIDDRTARLQTELWSRVRVPASANPTPVMVLVVSGMNDILNSQGYTLAAWRDRIPIAAWGLMAAMAICSTVVVGIGGTSAKANSRLLPVVLPLIISIAFCLIADLDTPRGGMIHVIPQNLLSLSQSLHAH